MYKHDGHTRMVESADIVAGTVLRTVETRFPTDSGGYDLCSPFADQVILGVYWTNARGERVYDHFKNDYPAKDLRQVVTLARPYLYANLTETSCPSGLMGFEKYEVDGSHLTGPGSRYRTVLDSRGKPYSMKT